MESEKIGIVVEMLVIGCGDDETRNWSEGKWMSEGGVWRPSDLSH